MEVVEPTLAARARVVGERLSHTVEEHPWPVVGAAALVGAWLGLQSRGRAIARARLVDALGAAVGAVFVRVAVQLAREAAMHELGEVAKRWWDETAPPARQPPAGADVH